MLRIGHGANLVNTIMCCVTSVSFPVLVNGVPTSTLYPFRGLQQGDPFSPYLFVFYAEALFTMIKRRVEEGVLHG